MAICLAKESRPHCSPLVSTQKFQFQFIEMSISFVVSFFLSFLFRACLRCYVYYIHKTNKKRECVCNLRVLQSKTHTNTPHHRHTQQKYDQRSGANRIWMCCEVFGNVTAPFSRILLLSQHMSTVSISYFYFLENILLPFGCLWGKNTYVLERNSHLIWKQRNDSFDLILSVCGMLGHLQLESYKIMKIV